MGILQLLAGIVTLWYFGDLAPPLVLHYWPQGGQLAVYAAKFLVFCMGCIVYAIAHQAWVGEEGGPNGFAGLWASIQRILVGVAIGYFMGEFAGALLAVMAKDLVPKLHIDWLWPGRAVAFMIGHAVAGALPSLLSLGYTPAQQNNTQR